MSNETFVLTNADMNAVVLKDAGYINRRGAKLYVEGNYRFAVEYYRLAAAMGDMNAVSNLGYCYLYGRDIEQNTSLAIAYFKTAAENGVIDAIYKLGDIYSSDKWNVKDVELSLYYYNIALFHLLGEGEWDVESIVYCEGFQRYPSLCYALGREMSRGGRMNTDIVMAYQLLKHAEKGYRKEIDNGAVMYESSYEGVKELLADSQFDGIRKEYDAYFAGEDYDEETE